MSILKVSIRQVKAARALLGWSQTDLASASGVSEPTVKRLEAQDGEIGGRTDTADKMRAALEAAGIEFTNGGQPGVRLKGRTNSLAVESNRIEHRLQNGEVLSFPLPVDLIEAPQKCIELLQMAFRTYWHFVDGDLRPARKVPRGTLPESVHAIANNVEICAWSREDELQAPQA